MELRVLRYYLTVVREENITRAAEILHITQPTLSRQISALEAELGTQLFERGKRKIVLTESGLLLRRRAEELISLADKTEREFSSHDGDIAGVVSIGSGESAAATELPKLLRSYSARFPQVQFELHTGVATAIRDKLDKGLLDIGLLIEPVEIEKYDFVRLPQKEVWGVLLPFGDPLTEKDCIVRNDLRARRLIVTQRMKEREAKAWFGGDTEHLNVYCTCDLAANAALLVEQGLGVAFTIAGAVANYNNVCFRPLSPAITSTSVLVWKKYQPFSPAVQKFIEEIKHAYRA
ncbi:MAG: LysR family transcriptional regulator [Oscillospiraceae bacterium]|jgi:DNA-binding transcriptional LysR family regulator|nr:LysR family transcriptional regulator [Oscillospiraceae bacterium]